MIFFQPFYVENISNISINQSIDGENEDNNLLVEKNQRSNYTEETDKPKSLCHMNQENSTSTSIQNILNLITFNDTKYGSSTSGIQKLENRLKKITSEGNGRHFCIQLEIYQYHYEIDLVQKFQYNRLLLLGHYQILLEKVNDYHQVDQLNVIQVLK